MEDILIYNTLDSTNKEAHRRISEGNVNSGLTLIAKEQTEGKGQMGRTWMAEPGNHLAMTIIYRPADLVPAALPAMSMKISLGIVHALTALYGPLHLKIKWPNDIYAGDKKLCGILIENTLSGQRVQNCIIGIGVNVNERLFPADIPNAISLFMLSGKTMDILDIARSIHTHVLDMITKTPSNWYESYEAYVYGKGEWHTFASGEETFEAMVHGVTADGLLVLEKKDGHTGHYHTHEIKWMISA